MRAACTTYSPDSAAEIDEDLSDEDNAVLYKKQKGSPRRSSGSILPSLSNDVPFIVIKGDKPANSQERIVKTSRKPDDGDDPTILYAVKGAQAEFERDYDKI